MQESSATTEHLDRLRVSARNARLEAVSARRLASDLDLRRELMVHRVDESRVRHVAEVWSSAAATRSRDELVHRVTGWLEHSAQSLRDTSVALEHEARRLESVAWSRAQQADVVEEDLAREAVAVAEDQAARIRSVSRTSLPG